jgi:hypothetical protein
MTESLVISMVPVDRVPTWVPIDGTVRERGYIKVVGAAATFAVDVTKRCGEHDSERPSNCGRGE